MAKLKPIRTALLASLAAVAVVGLGVMLWGDFVGAEKEHAKQLQQRFSRSRVPTAVHGDGEREEDGEGDAADADAEELLPLRGGGGEDGGGGGEDGGGGDGGAEGAESDEEESESGNESDSESREASRSGEEESGSATSAKEEASAVAIDPPPSPAVAAKRAPKGAPSAPVDPTLIPQQIRDATGQQPAKNVKCLQKSLTTARPQEAGLNWDRATTTEAGLYKLNPADP
jgi:hypothetical protein